MPSGVKRVKRKDQQWNEPRGTYAGACNIRDASKPNTWMKLKQL